MSNQTPIIAESITCSSARTAPKSWIVAAVLAISVGAVYSQALHAPFIFDDEISIVQNASIHSLWPLVGTAAEPGPLRATKDLPTTGRPLVNLSFAINYHFGGINPLGYRLFNITVHFLSAMFLWAIVRRTLRLPYFEGGFDSVAGWLALAVAMPWVLHPLQTEAVAYVTQRTELMMAFFYLATMYFSLRYWAAQTRRTLWLFVAIVACLCGMASKEVMVSAPLVILLYERTFIAGSVANALRRSWPLYVGLASTWLLVLAFQINAPYSGSAGFHLGLSLPVWWATQCKVLLMYLKLVVWPAPLLLHYELPFLDSFSSAWMFVLPVVILAILALVLLWRNKPLGFLLVASALILAPTSIVPIGTEMAAERRMYLSLAPLLALLVVGSYCWAQSLLKGKASSGTASFGSRVNAVAFGLPVVLIVLVFGGISWARLIAYNDPLQLWQQVAQHQPNNDLAHYNLGMLLNHAGRESESFAELQAAVNANPLSANARSAFGFALMNAGRLAEAMESLEAALAIDPDHVGALNNMGRLLILMERNAEAVEHLQHALRINPNHAEAHHNLGKALANVGQTDAAIEELKAALRLAPDDVDVLTSLGTMLTFASRLPEAIEVFEQVVRLRPNNGGAHNSLGIAMYRAGDVPHAIEHFQRFLELNPTNAGALCNLGNVYAGQGNFKQAVPFYEQALKLQPDFAEGHFSLALALVEVGQLPAAIEHFQTAIGLKPDFVPVYLNLARALAKAERPEDAIHTAQQGIEIARAAGDKPATDQLDEWLKKYESEQRGPVTSAPIAPTK